MTSDNTTPPEQSDLLAKIARTVESIEHSVDEIREQLQEHFEDVRLHQEWQAHGYDLSSSDRCNDR